MGLLRSQSDNFPQASGRGRRGLGLLLEDLQGRLFKHDDRAGRRAGLDAEPATESRHPVRPSVGGLSELAEVESAELVPGDIAARRRPALIIVPVGRERSAQRLLRQDRAPSPLRGPTTVQIAR
jgi:hypothetical protein